MSTLTAWHNEVRQTLNAALPTQFGPADTLPTEDGSVVQCAVLWPTTGALARRANGGTHQRTDSVLAVFVGPTVLDCLAAVGKGRKALEGARLVTSGNGGGRVVEGGFTGAQPTPEPGTDPVRVSLTVQFDSITKGPR